MLQIENVLLSSLCYPTDLQWNLAGSGHKLQELGSVRLIEASQRSPEPEYKRCELRWFSGRCVCWHSPDDLEAGGAVLVVLGVGLQVVNVDVRQTRQQQLQLLLVEDGNKSAIITLYF